MNIKSTTMRIKLFTSMVIILLIIVPLTVTNYFSQQKKKDKSDAEPVVLVADKEWKAPDTSGIAHTRQGDMIRYGRELILHTSVYFGNKGTVAHISNGMNCGDCHIDAGTRLWGNNFSNVAATYPLFRNRSGKIETVEMRINDCFERSLNGKGPGDSCKQMKAMVAYINWVGKDVSKGEKTYGSGVEILPFLNRAADTLKGKIVYVSICRKCHGKKGEGVFENNGKEYLYPPLWGKHSYNNGAGMYELSKFAGYIKNNMPFGTTFHNPQLTNEQAWDVAAYVNSQPRPLKDNKRDWPHLATKPFDYPFGPYSDKFSEKQHKYGPFGPIQQFYKQAHS
jgi:thiosulfate dehydrogenase